MAKKNKVLAAMSGGVDSSVAAALLIKAGYDVTGAFMVSYDGRQIDADCEQINADNKRMSTQFPPREERQGGCWRDDYQDALRVAAKLGIKLLRLDFMKEYQRMVLDYMYKEYSMGRTPNPDVLCNKFVKFGAWLDKARELGFDYLATGHYARIKIKNRELFILRTVRDKNKDQTYFLHQLNQTQLRQVVFPIGDYTKREVRTLAKKFGLPTADKEESMGICFIGEVPMKEFLEKRIKPKPGKIITTNGEVIGEHRGLPFYTIGERVGGVSLRVPTKSGRSNPITEAKPLFVVNKNNKKNELVVGYRNDPLLFREETQVGDMNWVSGHAPKFPLKCKVRLRHRQPLQKCHCEPAQKTREGRNKPMEVKKLFVKFISPQRAVTPGQFAVFYKRSECLGGGVILQ